MTFLREGGKAAGLSPEYTEWLSKLPTAPKNPLVAFTFGQVRRWIGGLYERPGATSPPPAGLHVF